MVNLNKYIKSKINETSNSNYNFESLFKAIHNQNELVFYEYYHNYKLYEITYKEFKSYVYKFATYLDKQINDIKHSFVGLYMENSIQWVACFWAILMLGYKPVLLNCKLPKKLNIEILDKLNVKTVVSNDNIFENLNNIIIDQKQELINDIQKLVEYKDECFEDEIVLTTTATSMNYKICIYNGSDITYQVLNAKGILKKNKMIKSTYNGKIKLLAFLPFYHVFGLIATYFWFSLFGRCFIFLTDYSSETFLKTVRKHEITHIFAVPLLWNTIVRGIKKEINLLNDKEKNKVNKAFKLSYFLQNAFPKFGMKVSRKMFAKITSKTLGSSIKFLISGGGYISFDTLYILNGIGYPLFNGYGSTEIGITSVELRKKPKYRIIGTIGKPFDTINYKIEDNTLFVKGKSICSKIIYRDGTTHSIDKNEWYNTKDNATVKKNYYYINGRNDDVVVLTNGEKINPDLIEKECFFTSVEHYSILGIDNKLSLVVEINDSLFDLKIKKICKEIEETTISLKQKGYILERIYYTSNAIVNPNAIKVSRTQLINKINNNEIILNDISNLKVNRVIEKDKLENCLRDKIKEIFSNVLLIDANSVNENKNFILDLGGSSLDYCTLLMKMKNEFNLEFDLNKANLMTVLDFEKYIMNNIKID